MAMDASADDSVQGMANVIEKEGKIEDLLKRLDRRLTTKNEEGWTVAHELAKNGSEATQLKLSEYRSILEVKDGRGLTVRGVLEDYGTDKVRKKLTKPPGSK
jgi:hypothetical protein